MLFSRRTRRSLGAVLIAGGIALMLLVPGYSATAWLLLGLALALELIGLALERDG